MKNITFILLLSIALHSYAKKSEVNLKLPDAVSNNAVASAKVFGHWRLYSFSGLLSGKSWNDVTANAYSIDLMSGKSKKLPSLPDKKGRLASIAATVNNKIYLFGGYTVEQDHSEVSTSEVFQFNPKTEQYSLVSKIPTPVDDSVALVYQSRYVYLVSGWHNDGNVNNVQIFDTETLKWFEASPFPGVPVFGHAAGIVDNKIVVVDGVKVADIVNGKRVYKMSPASYLGSIDQKDPTIIHWQLLPQHPYQAKYRMAAAGDKNKGMIIFAAGSDNPYNFNGVGYNGLLSEPSDEVFAWDINNMMWLKLPKLANASMDHRTLIHAANEWFIIGGMAKSQKVRSAVTRYRYD